MAATVVADVNIFLRVDDERSIDGISIYNDDPF